MTMHILFITGEYPPMRGGVGAYTAELAQALVGSGVQVSVLTARQVRSAMTSTSTAQPSAITVYPVVARWDGRIWWQAARLAQQIGATWLHVQYQTAAFAMNPAINLAPEIWRRQVNQLGQPLRVAWTYHDRLVPYLFPKAGSRLRHWVTDRPAYTSQLVIATNEGDYQQLAAQAIPARLVKIPIGSNIQVRECAATERRDERRQRGYNDQSVVLGYFGFLNRSKGGLTLVRTLHELVQQGYDAQLLMIGERVGASDPTNHAYLQEVETLIHTLQMERRVQWTGHLADAAVSEALQLVDLLFMPYTDGASLRRGTLMAGLAHGCAIVTTTPQSPLPELVDERDLCYVPPEEPKRAAAVITGLVNEPHRLETLRANARQQSQQFTWPTIAQQHLELYK